ncbi:unnamed protein product [Pylaiella littoralis]
MAALMLQPRRQSGQFHCCAMLKAAGCQTFTQICRSTRAALDNSRCEISQPVPNALTLSSLFLKHQVAQQSYLHPAATPYHCVDFSDHGTFVFFARPTGPQLKRR